MFSYYIYIYVFLCLPRAPRARASETRGSPGSDNVRMGTPNLPTNITPANIARRKLSGKSSLGLEIPPLNIKIMLEPNPLKSTMLVGRLAVIPLTSILQSLNTFNSQHIVSHYGQSPY